MKSSSVERKASSLTVFGPAVALLLALGCSGNGGGASNAGGDSGGSTGNGGSVASTATSGGTTSSGGAPGSGGTTGKAGTTTSAPASSSGPSSSGGVPGGGGTTPKGGTTAKGGTTNTATGSAGTTAAGGTTSKGGTTSTGTPGTGGVPGKDAGADGASGTGSTGDGGANCPTTMPEGGTTKTGKSVYGTAYGLGYGIWTNGVGGSITVYDNAHAFSASWNESQDFLAHLGLDFRPGKVWSTLGEIKAEFSEVKSGTAGGFSMIGIYGWTQSPCVEWYINEDSWKGMNGGSGTAVTIDGGTYYIRTLDTTGTGGANACESGHTGTWKQMISNRKGARTCGTVTVSDHFAAWEKQGWQLGSLTSVHINVEVGGGVGKIDFPLANVTVQNK